MYLGDFWTFLYGHLHLVGRGKGKCGRRVMRGGASQKIVLLAVCRIKISNELALSELRGETEREESIRGIPQGILSN